MSNQENLWKSLGIIYELTNRVPPGKLGRTAMMKLIYFLQAHRKVPLKYGFTLYNYGPFDSDVLDDIKYAETLKMVKSKLVMYPSGYGYIFSPEEIGSEIRERFSSFINEYDDDINWVVDNFGNLKASELELLSTIHFVKRESKIRGVELAEEELITQVKEIKPHFNRTQITNKIEYLDRLAA